jgi:glyoxylase-like metal-dependent hydrolase (beta-lactamase superfamily II)
MQIDLGKITVVRLAELEGTRVPPHFLFQAADAGSVRAACGHYGPSFIDPQSLELLLSFNSYVVRTAGLTILVDTCVGNHKRRPTRPFFHMQETSYIERLADLGVRPEDVDYVMCTHLHADHVGWNTRLDDGRWVPTFPKARYLIAAKEYEYWSAEQAANPNGDVAYGSFADSVLPVVATGQVDFVAGDHQIASGVFLQAAPGHTPGNVVVHLHGATRRAVASGDVLHHPIQLMYPEWSTSFCVDPVQSHRSRLDFINSAVASQVLVLPAHFQSPSVGKIVRDGRGYRYLFGDRDAG